MFINIQGPPSKDPARRRTINIHLSKIAKAKRPPKYEVAKLDRKEAQQKRRRREADLKRAKADRDFEAWILALYDQDIRDSFLLSSDLITPGFIADDMDGIMACRDWFQFSLPHDARALGLSTGATNAYARVLLSWAFRPGGMILYGLGVYRLCILPESQDSQSFLRRRIEILRSKLINGINDELQKGNVDDVLIQAIVLAIAVDDYLNYIEFNEAHLKGLEAVVEHRGGLDVIGSSEAAMGDNLRQSLLMSVGSAKLRIGTTLSPKPTIRFGNNADELTRYRGQKVAHKLPHGFQVLAFQGYLSYDMIMILVDFSDWLEVLSISDANRSRAWRQPVPVGLSNLEKCIFVALICLADDMTAMGSHVSALLWRKPAQRVQMLLDEKSLWNSSGLIKCVVWLATIVSTPRKVEITPHAVSNEIRQKIMRQAPEICASEAVAQILAEFFLPASRRQVLLDSWAHIVPSGWSLKH